MAGVVSLLLLDLVLDTHILAHDDLVLLLELVDRLLEIVSLGDQVVLLEIPLGSVLLVLEDQSGSLLFSLSQLLIENLLLLLEALLQGLNLGVEFLRACLSLGFHSLDILLESSLRLLHLLESLLSVDLGRVLGLLLEHLSVSHGLQLLLEFPDLLSSLLLLLVRLLLQLLNLVLVLLLD